MSDDAKDPIAETRAMLAAVESARRARNAAEATLNAMGGEDPGVIEAALAARMADFGVDDAERALGASTSLLAALCDEIESMRLVIHAAREILSMRWQGPSPAVPSEKKDG